MIGNISMNQPVNKYISSPSSHPLSTHIPIICPSAQGKEDLTPELNVFKYNVL
jgi:hypothetical protein